MKRIYVPNKKKTILIVDDDQVAVRIYRENFESEGFKVEVADNGHKAMQTLKNEPVDLVIFDLCLPGVNGVEVLENIRLQFNLRVLPVIVFLNAYLGNLRRVALEAGATRCVTKVDSTPGQMLELVRELLGAGGNSNTVGAIPGVGGRDASGTLGSSSQTEFQAELVATLLGNAPETLAKLRAGHQAFARAEPEDLRRTELVEMHRHLRSLAGGLLGFPKIARMADALEALLIELQVKPRRITPSVVRTVAQAIDTLASLFDHAADPPAGTVTAPRILVVDDEVISRETICSALGKAGLVAVSLDDSLAAQRQLEENRFDLIFLDVEMPGQSGLDLCVNIREMATNCTTPVVFVTARSDFGSRAQSTLSGGNDFIAKPFLLVELAVKALTWLFKESPPPLSTAIAQDSAPIEADGHEPQPSLDPGTPSETDQEALRCRAGEKFVGAIS